MENGWKNVENGGKKWSFRWNEELDTNAEISIRGTFVKLMKNMNGEDERSIILIGHGDLATSKCFRTSHVAEEAVLNAVKSGEYNFYSPSVGTNSARRAVAEYLSKDLPYQLSPNDVYMTVGCAQAIEVILTVLASPGANILIPKPGFTHYEARCAFSRLEVRHYDLLPEQGWEVDLDAVASLADKNTVAMVLINPGNPCGTVFSSAHLEKVAETARRLGILVIADEVYSHLVFGKNPFVPMGTFGSIVPTITLGSISKRWAAPGWRRLGWLAITDPNGTLQTSKMTKLIQGYLNIIPDPATIMQGALPQILETDQEEFFSKIINTLKESSEFCYEKIKEIPCLTCPHKSEGSMFMMVKLNLSLLDDIVNDMDFCLKLANEERVILTPGVVVGLKNWLRVSFAIEKLTLEEGLDRIKSFCKRHANK